MKSASPASTLISVVFNLSTSPSGACAEGEAGSPGDIQGPVLWDGTNGPENQPDPAHIRVVSPEEKNFYVVVRAKVTLPNGYHAPISVKVIAERIRYTGVNPNRVATAVVGPGNKQDLTLLHVPWGDPEGEGPVADPSGQGVIHTYRTHEKPDKEHYNIAGVNDWRISDKMGRWRLRIDDLVSAPIEFKIDKRTQLANYARDWADFWPTTQPRNDALVAAWYPADTGTLFGDCGGFASHVYGRHGLSISTTYAAAEGQSTVNDAGKGSLRFFYGPAGGVLHVGMLVSGNQVVDNNNAVYGAIDRGVYLHGKADGMSTAWPFNNQYDSAQEKTLPAVVALSLSILQELDGE